MEINLPTEKKEVTVVSPENLIIFSKPKTGKTSLTSALDNWLVLDFDKGSKSVKNMSINVESVEHVGEIVKKIKEVGMKYNGAVIDTATVLEDMCVIYAEKLYAKTSMGKNWFLKTSDGKLSPESGKAQYGTIINLPNGAGYQYVREGFMKVINLIQTVVPRIIIMCHVKDILLDKKGIEFSSMEIDLTGKLKRIVTSGSDAIGYLYRKGNQNILSFATTEEISCGARPEHLSNKQIVISEKNEDGTLSVYWDRIYID